MKYSVTACAGLMMLLVGGFSWAGQTIDLDGMMVPYQIVEIRSSVEGIIEKILVDRGDLVKKDQVLAVLESGPEQAEVDLWQFRTNMDAATNSAKARLEVLNHSYERVGELYHNKIVSQSEYEEAEAERKLAEAQLLEAQENKKLAELELQRAREVLGRRSIKSPFSGVVTDRFLNPGAVATTDDKQPILKLAAIDPIYVYVVAPVSFLGQVKEGNKLVVFPEVPSGSQYSAVIKRVDKVADASSGTFAIRAVLPNPDFRIPAGVKCRVKIVLDN